MPRVQGAIEQVWEVLFPARCLGCGRRDQVLCSACAPSLPLLPPEACARCALPPLGSGPCRACSHLSPALASVRAVFAYEGLARKAVHTLKFRSGRYLVPTMGAALRESLGRRPLAADLVVPVPLSGARMRERGYNQAELLAREVAQAVGGVLATGLLAREDRRAQQTLAAAERRTNVLGAFRCLDVERVRGRRLCVVDDVMTTGATLSACADALAAGASWIGAVVYARDL